MVVNAAECHFERAFVTACDAPRMRCHVISQQAIKREHALANPRRPRFDFEPSPLTGTKLADLLADPRNWRWGCWRHHQHVDGPHGEWPEIPATAREFAAQYGLERLLPDSDRRYPPVSHVRRPERTP